jgi:aminomethyltransferase
VKLGREFVGASALMAQLELGLKKKLVGLQTDDGRTVARQGYRVLRDGVAAGVVTSGTFAPSIQRPVAMAYLDASARVSNRLGEKLEVEVRGRNVPATVVRRPFYRRAEISEASPVHA